MKLIYEGNVISFNLSGHCSSVSEHLDAYFDLHVCSGFKNRIIPLKVQ